MEEEEELIGSLTNRAQADDDKRAEGSDGKDSGLGEFVVEGTGFQAKR